MSNITWPDFVDGGPVPGAGHLNAAKLNEIKTSTNSKLEFEPAATYSAISASVIPRLVRVAADETNNGLLTWYIHTGTALELFNFLTP